MYLNAFPGCLCLLKLFLYTGNVRGSFSEVFYDEIAVVTLLESENILKLRPSISLIWVRLRDGHGLQGKYGGAL
jgi:hypothetical protein